MVVTKRSRIIATFIYFSLIVASFALSFHLHSEEKKERQVALNENADRIARSLETAMLWQVDALERMAKRFQARGAPDEKGWRDDASAFTGNVPGLKTLAYVDAQLHPVWVEPKPEREAFAALLAQQKIPAERDTAMMLDASGEYLIVLEPVESDENGWIGAIFNGQEWVDARRLLLSKQYADVHFGYMEMGDKLVAHEEVETYELKWPLTVLPTADFIAHNTTKLPLIVLIFGTITAGFLTLLYLFGARHLQQTRDMRQQSIEIAKSETLFRLAMRHAPVGMALVSLDGRFMAVNPALCAIVGYSETELLANDFQGITHPDDLEKDMDQVKVLLRHEADSYVLAKRYMHKNGSLVWVMLHAALLSNVDGSPNCFISQIQDITESRRLDEQRNQLIEKLANSNADLERFAFIASHDLQEPLRMICNFTSLLEQEYGDKLDENARSYIKIATSSANQMRSLIGDLLDYARASHGEANRQAPFLADEAADEIRKNLNCIIVGTQATLTIAPLPPLWGDRIQFSTLLQNLIGNALKYQKPGVPPEIDVSATRQGEFWVFRVSDNGIGMKSTHFQQIFEPFKRLHNREQYQGTGMGLAICEKIVAAAGGRIWVESTPGTGSAFFFTWPAVADD